MKVIEGKITSRFGGRIDPIEGGYTIHQGVDIAAPIGTSVFSPTDGVVVSIYNHRQGGLTMIIRPKGEEMRYGMCHLSKVLVEEGQTIWRGDEIALSGNSGRTTGAHLHYSVKDFGKWYADQYIGGHFVDSEKYIEIAEDDDN